MGGGGPSLGDRWRCSVSLCLGFPICDPQGWWPDGGEGGPVAAAVLAEEVSGKPGFPQPQVRQLYKTASGFCGGRAPESWG